MDDSLINQAVELMILGMGVVFAFLTLLVWCTALMSRVVASWKTQQEPARGVATADETVLRVVIAEAIRQHRSKREQ